MNFATANFATVNFATMNSTDPAGIKSTAAETASGEPTKSAGVGNSLPDPSNSTGPDRRKVGCRNNGRDPDKSRRTHGRSLGE